MRPQDTGLNNEAKSRNTAPWTWSGFGVSFHVRDERKANTRLWCMAATITCSRVNSAAHACPPLLAPLTTLTSASSIFSRVSHSSCSTFLNLSVLWPPQLARLVEMEKTLKIGARKPLSTLFNSSVLHSIYTKQECAAHYETAEELSRCAQ